MKIQTPSFRTILIIIVVLLATSFFLFNLFTHKYQASSYISFNNFLVMLPAYVLYMFSKNIKDSHPSMAFALKGFWLIFFVTFVINYFTVTIQYTPFKLHDTQLQQWDDWLGFNLVAFVNWIHQYPHFVYLLKMAYNSNIKQLIFIPICLVIFQQRRRFDVFLNALLLSFIIGYVIYYFFPTAGPAKVIADPYFSPTMYSIPIRFYDVQHYIPDNDLLGGIISLPSFHTIWAILAAYSVKNYKYIFYPLLLWNCLIIIATLALGWHFLVDIIAGAIIAVFSIAVSEFMSNERDIPFKEMIQLYRKEIAKK